MRAEKSPRAEDLSQKLHKLFTEHEGDGAGEKLENIKVLINYLTAQAGGYNSCCITGNFAKGSPMILSREQLFQLGQVGQELCLAIESLVDSFASDLKDSIAGVVALCLDKWSKYFAEKAAAAAQGQKKGRS